MAKRQTKIPGTEGPTIKEINTAAEHYVEQRDKRMKLTEKEVEAKDALIAAMRKHKLETYRDEDFSPPLVVQLIPGEARVKVHEAEEEERRGDDALQEARHRLIARTEALIDGG